MKTSRQPQTNSLRQMKIFRATENGKKNKDQINKLTVIISAFYMFTKESTKSVGIHKEFSVVLNNI